MFTIRHTARRWKDPRNRYYTGFVCGNCGMAAPSFDGRYFDESFDPTKLDPVPFDMDAPAWTPHFVVWCADATPGGATPVWAGH